MLSIASSACLALPPAFVSAPAVDRVVMGDYTVCIYGPGAGLWLNGALVGAPLLVWPCSAVSEGAEIGGFLLRHPGTAALLSIEVRALMGLGTEWLAGRLLASRYHLKDATMARALTSYLWLAWLRHVAVTPQGVLKAGSPEACRALKTPVWQEVAHVHA